MPTRWRPGARRGGADRRAHRRRPLPQRARERPGRSCRSARRARCPCSSEIVAARAERSANAGVALARGLPPDARAAAAAADAGDDRRNLVDNALRYAGTGATFTLRARDDGDAVVLVGDGHRAGRAGGRPASPLRAVLPLRPRTLVARHRARPRHRQAHRHVGRRHGGGAGRRQAAGSRSDAPSRSSCNQIVTRRSPPRRPAALRRRETFAR